MTVLRRDVQETRGAASVFRRRLIGILYVVYLAALVVAVEVSIRHLDIVAPYTPQPETAIKLYYEEPNGLVLLRPGAKYFTHGDVPMEINADGYRDIRYSHERASNSRRIAVIGDSFTMGDGVPLGDTYPKQLEQMIREMDSTVEVINFGITATNSLQQLELLRTKVLPYRPDVIMLGFNLNDYKIYTETSFDRSRRLYGVDFFVHADKTVTVKFPVRTGIESVKAALHRNFALYRLLQSLKSRAPPEAHTSAGLEGVNNPEVFARINGAVRLMSALSREAGAEFLLLMLPAMTEIDRKIVRDFAQYPFIDIESRIAAKFEKYGIWVVNTLPAFDGRTVREVTVSRFDPHFNEFGNRLLARKAWDALLQRKSISF